MIFNICVKLNEKSLNGFHDTKWKLINYVKRDMSKKAFSAAKGKLLIKELQFVHKLNFTKSLCLYLLSRFYYAPNFEEVEEAYWFWPVHPSVCYTCTWPRTVRDRILKFGM